LAEQVDGGGERELSGAEASDEIAAANAATFFEGFEHVVDSAEASGDVFCGDGFSRKDAVAVEELKRERVAGLGGGRGMGMYLRG
jgi:hypothetical protein